MFACFVRPTVVGQCVAAVLDHAPSARGQPTATAELSCAGHGARSVITDFVFSGYGLPAGTCTGRDGGKATSMNDFAHDSECDLRKYFLKLATEPCVGLANCSMRVDAAVFRPDPCPGTRKWFSAAVSCSADTHTGTVTGTRTHTYTGTHTHTHTHTDTVTSTGDRDRSASSKGIVEGTEAGFGAGSVARKAAANTVHIKQAPPTATAAEAEQQPLQLHTYIIDFGRNFQGGLNLTITNPLPRPVSIHVGLGEELNPDGSVMCCPARSENMWSFNYTLAPSATQTITTHEYVHSPSSNHHALAPFVTPVPIV